VGKEEQLQWERKWAPAAALAAVVAAFLPFAGSLWTQSYLRSLPTTHSEDPLLHQIHDHASSFMGAAVLSAIGTLFIAPVLVYLYRAIAARRPQIPRIALILAVAAPLIAAGAGIARTAVIAHTADQYVAAPLPATTAAEREKLAGIRDPKKYADEVAKNASEAANKKLTAGALPAVSYIEFAGNILVGLALLLIALHAMRAGLVSRFMGVVGVIAGALTALPVLGGGLLPLQLFWFLAMAILFLNRWPQGRGPAWDAVEPIPWPTAQDRRDAMAGGDDQPARPRGGLFQRPAVAEAEEDEPDVQHTREAARPRPSSTHPRSKKRKRKRRG
jgi:Domain of unknown function (DUF4386)